MIRYRDLEPIGFPGHRVGDDGTVQKFENERWNDLKTKKSQGFGTVLVQMVNGDGKFGLSSVARLVLTSFVGFRKSPVVFKDNDVSNVKLSNLTWSRPAREKKIVLTPPPSRKFVPVEIDWKTLIAVPFREYLKARNRNEDIRTVDRMRRELAAVMWQYRGVRRVHPVDDYLVRLVSADDFTILKSLRYKNVARAFGKRSKPCRVSVCQGGLST